MASRMVYDSAAIRIGAFRSRPGDRDFAESGPTRGHLLVFPRETVTITHAGRRPIVADPTRIMIYNRGQAYARGAIGPRGDRCEWFAFPAEAILEARGDLDGDRDRPFGALMCAPSEPRSYLLARRAYEHVVGGGADALFVEEVAATLLDRVLAPAGAAVLSRPHAQLADAARRSVAVRFVEPRSLAEIAAELGVSAFHLARVFRRATGRSIHAHRTQLRMCAALDRIGDTPDLAALALELGFAHHSHFTAVFRATFGAPPSHVRQRLRARS